MKRLILVRHAKAESTVSCLSDVDRELVTRGENDAAMMALKLNDAQIIPEIIITSLASRALQTAQIFAEVWGVSDKRIFTEEFIYEGYTTHMFLEYLSSLGERFETIAIFGHNPDLAELVVQLTKGGIAQFPTCSVAVVDFDVNDWGKVEAREGKLTEFIYPKMFKGQEV